MRRHGYMLSFALAVCIACVSPPPEAGVPELSSAPTADTVGYVKAMKLPIASRSVIVSPVRSTERLPLTPEQAREDIDTLAYLLDTAYSGRDYWEMRGMDFEGMYESLRAFIDGRTGREASDLPVANWDIEDRIASLFSSIDDNHLGVIGRTPHFANRHKTAYFADLLVEERGDGFIVIESGAPGVKRGARYTGAAGSLYRTLSPTGRRHYLAGALSYSRISRLGLSFDDAAIDVPVHTSRIGRIAYQNVRDFIRKDIDGVPLLSVCSFAGKSPDGMRQFMDSGSDILLRQAAHIVLDLRENCGGSRAYPQQFLSNLYRVPEFQAMEIRQFSPSIVEATLSDPLFKRTAAGLKDDSPAFFEDLSRKYKRAPAIERALFGRPADAGSSFRGALIHLANRRTGSAAEIAISYARAAKRNLLVGENTEGAMTFGNVRYYQLEHSRIILALPSSIVIVPGFRETEGFLPDYWIDSERPEEEVAHWLRDPDRYRFRVKTQ